MSAAAWISASLISRRPLTVAQACTWVRPRKRAKSRCVQTPDTSIATGVTQYVMRPRLEGITAAVASQNTGTAINALYGGALRVLLAAPTLGGLAQEVVE